MKNPNTVHTLKITPNMYEEFVTRQLDTYLPGTGDDDRGLPVFLADLAQARSSGKRKLLDLQARSVHWLCYILPHEIDVWNDWGDARGRGLVKQGTRILAELREIRKQLPAEGI